MAAPGRAIRPIRLTPGELYRRHVQRKKMIALIAGLLLLPVSLALIATFDDGPLGQAAQSLGLSLSGPRAGRPTATAAVIAQNPSPAPCQDTVFNGLVYDADSGALLNGVQVQASFGAGVVTSPDGEYNILVCYDASAHDSFTLVFTLDGYQTASMDVVTSGYPGIGFQVPDLGLIPNQSATPEATLFQPPRQTPLPTPFQPPRQTPQPTLFQPPRQTPLPTAAESVSGPGVTATPEPTQASGSPAVTPAPSAPPPSTLPETGLPATAAFPGQAVGYVLLAISLMLIAAGVWPYDPDAR